MGNLLTAQVTICGSSTIIWHHCNPNTVALETQEPTSLADNMSEKWPKTVLTMAQPQMHIEPSYVFDCLRNGAKYTKRGRNSLQPYIVDTLLVIDELILADRFTPPEPLSADTTELAYLNMQSIKLSNVTGHNARYYAASAAGWQLVFTVRWDKTVINRNEMEAVTRSAGRFVGLGYGRIRGYGRFDLSSFQVDDT